MTPEGLQRLKSDEGTRLKVYDDATGNPIVPGTLVRGHPTIGTGRSLDIEGIGQAENDLLFSNDVLSRERQLEPLPWFSALDPVRQDVVTNLAFNVGVGGALQFHQMIAALEAKNFDDAATALLDSAAARQLPGRYGRLAQALRTGSWQPPEA